MENKPAPPPEITFLTPDEQLDAELAAAMASAEKTHIVLWKMATRIGLSGAEHFVDAYEAGHEAGLTFTDSVTPEQRPAIHKKIDGLHISSQKDEDMAELSSEKIEDLHTLLRDYTKMPDEEFESNYKFSKSTFLDRFQIYKKLVERVLLFGKAEELNGNFQMIDSEAGIYAITAPSGDMIFGSIYAIIDGHPELSFMRKYASLIRSGSVKDGSIMAAKTSGSSSHRSVMVASGSFAQPEVNPHPADYDFSEHLDIKAGDKVEAGNILAQMIRETITRTLAIDDNAEFSTIKLGTYPDYAPPNLIGKSLKWTAQEIEAGKKQITDNKGRPHLILLQEACQNPGAIKLDWILLTDDGQLKEMTKVINLRVIRPDGTIIMDKRQRGASFQELYFDDISSLGLTEELRNPESFLEFLDFLERDIHKYGDQQSTHPNFLKAAKRAYSLLRLMGDIDEARTIAEGLFDSPAAELAARTETCRLLPAYVRAIRDRDGKVDISSITGALQIIGNLASRNLSLFGESSRDFLENLKKLQVALAQDDLESIETLSQTLFNRCDEAVNEYTYNHLSNNLFFKKLLE